ncbi:MAG: (E)-4-hydroxy-3-methylbut-2-enyl-diphosphate synthase [Bacteroidota bacterium]|nr:(E)-4-hydroxy-3-methylbut-2-enyl-diphosphate synthase [Bacteroidota bacterium]
MKKKLPLLYCDDFFNYRRIESREILIGNLKLGGGAPICVQSMTDTSTMDTLATVEQSKRIFDAGADLVRITAPAIRDAKNLTIIREKLNLQGYTAPLAADIHYNPKAALEAARHVEKVRINPGNYIDKNTGDKFEFSDQEYANELNKIHKNLLPLIRQCKKTGTAIRIGTNHGSLSDRIVAKYGDTPKGMVESTMEFLRIFAKEDFHDIVLSLKSSNARVMVFANRLLVKQMKYEGFNYPLHLGVTEAGDGEDGRIKSAVGIATLLIDGIGDTIRVSLTEAPEMEIPVAKNIVEYIGQRDGISIQDVPKVSGFDPYNYKRRASQKVSNIGNNEVPVVIADFSQSDFKEELLLKTGFKKEGNKWLQKADQTPDYIYLGNQELTEDIQSGIDLIFDFESWKNNHFENENRYPVLTVAEYQENININNKIKFLRIKYSELNSEIIQQIKTDKNAVILAGSESKNRIGELRAIIFLLKNSDCKAPIIPFHIYYDNSPENFQLKASCDFGPLCIDSFVDGIMIQASPAISEKQVLSTSFGILQAGRLRISKTEYISCPGCGRTLFALQETTKKIRARTSHLKGLKIGIMGCIVNGPGEMADADFGYVGTGPGKISLYRNKELIRKNIPESEAVEALVQLIKDNGKWVEKLSC